MIAGRPYESGRSMQVDETGLQRDVAVGVELADRNPQPVRLVEGHDRVVGELAELGDAQPGSGEHLDHEAALRVESDSGGHEPGGLVVVEELRQWLVQSAGTRSESRSS